MTTLNNKILKDYICDTFVETGTYQGEGVDEAIKAGFKNIYSVELHNQLHADAVEKFKENTSVNIVKGDSSLMLSEVLALIDTKATFWLDGHYSGTHTAMGTKVSPVMEELEQIKTHSIKIHNILIDDIRYIHNGEYGFTIEEVIKKIKQINKKYQIAYLDGYQKDDILVAYI